jgi:hypothetical protein
LEFSRYRFGKGVAAQLSFRQRCERPGTVQQWRSNAPFSIKNQFIIVKWPQARSDRSGITESIEQAATADTRPIKRRKAQIID